MNEHYRFSPQTPINILFVTHMAELQGAERSLLDLVLGLRSTRASWPLVRPLVLAPRHGPFTELLARERVDFRVIPYKSWLNQSRWPLQISYRLLVNALMYPLIEAGFRHMPPDLVYSNSLYTPIGALLARRLALPHIWHVREFVHEDMRAGYAFGTRPSMRFIAASSRIIICNSLAVERKMARYIDSAKLLTIYNGVLEDGRRRAYQPRCRGLVGRQSLTLCIVGTISEHKGQQDALRACAVLRSRGVPAVLRIVGKGLPAAMQAMQRLAGDLGIRDVVRWEGFSDRVEQVFATSDIALVCSRHEGFGRVAIEAMATGCPVIGTAAGGLTEVIIAEETGLLYRPGNIADLVAQIERLIDDPALYVRLSQQALATAYQKFSRQRYVSEIAEVIQHVGRAET
jgi:glycosyltransferase involved in cell wall biosynthesis